MLPVIGRKAEIQTLDSVWKSRAPELVALYGRRRIGKTYLVRQVLGKRGLFIEATGIKNASMRVQIANFTKIISDVFAGGLPLEAPSSWSNALALLTRELKKLPKSKKAILFLDELPWMATRRSGLIQALDYYWNTQWSRIPNLKVILCGSAASWILDNLVNAKGGLHNRLTRIIHLAPFDLRETKLFLEARGVKMKERQIVDVFLVTGGVPYYLEQIRRSRSAVQNIDALCFRPSGILYSEFPRIFRALFEQAETNLRIVKEIARYRYGLDRNRLLAALKMKSGGSFNKRIAELEAAGFIRAFRPYGKATRDTSYRVIDEYSLFYLRWIEPEIHSGFEFSRAHWKKVTNSPAWFSWAGYAFEDLCLKHTQQICNALEIGEIRSRAAVWRHVPKKGKSDQGAQIDLLFDRDDDTITICAIKYSTAPFVIDKSYAEVLMKKVRVFEEKTRTKKQLLIAMITAGGLKPNLWAKELIDHHIDLTDLFQ